MHIFTTICTYSSNIHNSHIQHICKVQCRDMINKPRVHKIDFSKLIKPKKGISVSSYMNSQEVPALYIGNMRFVTKPNPSPLQNTSNKIQNYVVAVFFSCLLMMMVSYTYKLIKKKKKKFIIKRDYAGYINIFSLRLSLDEIKENSNLK